MSETLRHRVQYLNCALIDAHKALTAAEQRIARLEKALQNIADWIDGRIDPPHVTARRALLAEAKPSD